MKLTKTVKYNYKLTEETLINRNNNTNIEKRGRKWEKIRGMKIKIPLVYKDYNINCIDIIKMCRIEGWKF